MKRLKTTATVLAVWLLGLSISGAGCHKKPDIGADLKQNLHSIMVVMEPKDLALYQSLLPRHPEITLPEKPLVGIYVAYFPVPAISFVESGVTIRCNYQGREGWTLLTNTVARSERLIYHAARLGGFPKFQSESVSLHPAGEGWTGRVTADGKTWVRLEFSPREIPGALPDWQRQFLAAEKYQLTDPLYLLVPPLQGPKVRLYDLSSLSAKENRKIEQGLVKIVTESEEPWTGLLPTGDEAPGLFILDQ